MTMGMMMDYDYGGYTIRNENSILTHPDMARNLVEINYVEKVVDTLIVL